MKTLKEVRTEWDALAQSVMQKATAMGLEAELHLSVGQRLSVRVRKGEIEAIRQSTPSSASLRVFNGNRSVSGSTAPLELPRILALLERLGANVELVTQDPLTALPNAEWLLKGEGPSLNLFDAGIEGISVERCAQLAAAAEKAAAAVDTRIKNFDDSSAGTQLSISGVYNTRGLAVVEQSSYISVDCNPVAEDDKGNKFAEGWFTHGRHLADLDTPENVGQEAARRALAMIGAGTTPTGKFPVLFDAETANGLLAHLFEAVSGTNLYRKSSYLTGKLGQPVASPLITVVDDPLLPKGLSSTVCDNEGVATRRQVLVDAGAWKVIPTDSYSARKLETASTGNGGGGAVRSYNLFVANGQTPKEELLKTLDTGLYVTSFIGFGFNLATGDFSRGARGYWVEKGKVVRPVQEITVSGNLDEMLKNVIAVGNDLEHRFGTDSPSLLIKDVTVSGGEK